MGIYYVLKRKKFNLDGPNDCKYCRYNLRNEKSVAVVRNFGDYCRPSSISRTKNKTNSPTRRTYFYILKNT
jgi:hypothetical protein